jgi:hypothetical protein
MDDNMPVDLYLADLFRFWKKVDIPSAHLNRKLGSV